LLAGRAPQLKLATLAGSLALFLSFLFLTLELNTFLFHFVPALRAGGISILWSMFALGLIVAGIHRQKSALRYTGLALFTVVGFKVFFADLANLDQFYRIVAFIVVFAVALGLWLMMRWTDTGKAIRAVAKEKLGAELAGIEVAHIYAVTFGIGTACVAIAACLLIPSYYVNPHAGNAFVLIAFTVVVLGGMGSVPGALIAGLFVGVVESLSGYYLGESLGQISIFVVFILVLLFRPSGLFGERA